MIFFFLHPFFVIDHSTLNVNCLLKFCTGLLSVPPLGLEENISISYIAESLPKAQACFCRLMLPTVHSSFDEFCKAFCLALEYGAGYGSV